MKDIICDLEKKTVTVVYDTRKTDTDTLLKAFERIGKPAKVLKKNEDTGTDSIGQTANQTHQTIS